MNRFLRFASPVLLSAILAISASAAESGYVDLGKFKPAEGCEFVEVNLHAPLIKLASHFVDREEPAAAEILRSLKHVRVNVVGFNEDNRADTTDRVQKIRSELEAQGWIQMVTVHEAEDVQDVGVFVKMQEDETIDGVVVTVIDRSENKAVFVNVVGNIRPEQLAALGDKLNIAPLSQLSLKRGKKNV